MTNANGPNRTTGNLVALLKVLITCAIFLSYLTAKKMVVFGAETGFGFWGGFGLTLAALVGIMVTVHIVLDLAPEIPPPPLLYRFAIYASVMAAMAFLIGTQWATALLIYCSACVLYDIFASVIEQRWGDSECRT